ncbi:MAG: dihydropteroate synthase [Candidatus Cryptobacteroides sp.]
MGIINLTPDSFFEKSRYNYSILSSRADIVDVGAISTRPGAEDVSLEEEWKRLEPFLLDWRRSLKNEVESVCGRGSDSNSVRERDSVCESNSVKEKDSVIEFKSRALNNKELSIDTTRAEIVRRAYEIVGPFIVNDISAGEEDPQMLGCVGELALKYIAMHKRGNPRTMDALADEGMPIMEQLEQYFIDFERRAEKAGVKDWILDPGLGFAKTKEQNVEIIEKLPLLKKFGRPILIGAADKRFTEGNTEYYHLLALRGGADLLRVHDVEAAYLTYAKYQRECEESK